MGNLYDLLSAIPLHDANLPRILDWIRSVVEACDSQLRDIQDTGRVSSGIVLIGGGGGAATVSRALQSLSVTDYGLIAPTGKSVRRRHWLGHQVNESSDSLTRWSDIVRMCLHGRPIKERNHPYEFFDLTWNQKVRIGYLFFEVVQQMYGLQRACEVFNALLGNSFCVAPTTEDRTELHYVVGGQTLNFHQYILRHQLEAPAAVFLSPTAQLSRKARTWLSEARVVIIGPGDVTLTTQFHFCVNGLREVLARNSDAEIVLVANLTARDIDLPGFRLSQFLDYWGNLLYDRRVYVVVNSSPFDGSMTDDVNGHQYHNFHLVRSDLIGQGLTDDQQPKHDSVKLGLALKNLLS